jgi:DNA-binding response OmpR family regulator
LKSDPKFSKGSLGSDSLGSSPIRILIIDDDYDTASSLETGLRLKGFKADMYTNPRYALSCYRPNYYDLLLIDIRMPEMSGFELYRKLREKDRNVRICFTTSFSSYYESLKETYPELATICMLSKPISLNDLVRRIKAEVGRD